MVGQCRSVAVTHPEHIARGLSAGNQFGGNPRRFRRIKFSSLNPITMVLKSLQIRLQSPERQFGKEPVNARRLQPRYR
jgi:hypothetical protein